MPAAIPDRCLPFPSQPAWRLQEAAWRAVKLLEKRLNGHGGIILVDTRGRVGIAHNTPRMAWAMRRGEEEAAGICRPAPAR